MRVSGAVFLALPAWRWLTAGAGCGQARGMDERVVVVGAGPAGLAAAWAIRRVGIDPLIAEKAGVVAASWRARHDQLRLNTHRMFSHQPGVRIPRRYGPFPARDEYVAYLERYAAGLRIRFGAAVSRIDRAGPGWQLDLGEGSLSTAQVVVATGPDAEPIMPSWPGMGSRACAGPRRQAAARPAHPTSSSAPPATGPRWRRWSGTWWHWMNPVCRRSPARRPRRFTPAYGSSGWTAASTATCTSTGGRHHGSRR